MQTDRQTDRLTERLEIKKIARGQILTAALVLQQYPDGFMPLQNCLLDFRKASGRFC